jgi:uncharacterized protein YgiM (DUF1202 family)
MSRSYSRRRSSRQSSHTFMVFLLVASFGILFAGCSGPEDVGEDDTLVFTDEDMEQYRQIADSASGTAMTGSGEEVPSVEPIATGSGSDEGVTLDLSMVPSYASMRQGVSGGAGFQVTNDFLNVRETPSTGAATVERLEFGASVSVIEFLNSQWAKVKLASGKEGYVAHRYLSKVTSEERLADEKKQYENMFYVSFGFVNMRKSPDQASEKLVEIPGGTILRPSQVQGGWAKVTFDGKEGYVSESYLAPFLPNFVVRQDTYQLPVLHYRLTADRTEELMQGLSQQVSALREQGYAFTTFSALRDLLLAQQQRDVRLDPKQVIVAVSGINPDNIKTVSSALNIAGINATFFIETQHVGLSGITEKSLLTMMANGFDIQSATHTGDDLRALTNAQAELELQQSRKLLEDYTHKTVFAVAYPQGGVNDRIAQIAADAGYLFGIGDDADRTFSRSQLLRVPAMAVFPSMSTEEVVKFVTGS